MLANELNKAGLNDFFESDSSSSSEGKGRECSSDDADVAMHSE